MNYGKKGSKKRQAELTSKGIMYGKKMRVIFCKVLLVCCFAVAIIGGSLGFGVYKGILDSAPSIDDIDATPTGYLTTVLDNQGNEIATLVASGSNRKNVTIDEIPINLQHAFVALEDSVFTSTMVSTLPVSSVPALPASLPAVIFPRVPVRSHSSF